MPKILRLIIIFLLMLPLFVLSQNKPELQVLKLSVDDDFFNYRGQGTDREYTAGTKIDFLYTKNTKHNFFDKLLLQLSGNADNLYGWGIAQLIFNPNNTSSQSVVYGDRPYAGVLYVNHSLVSSDDINKQKITTQLDVGVIGKYAFAEQTQNFVHNLIHYRDVEGWDHQITTDIIVNYFIEYEKLIFQPSPNLEIIGMMESNTGTWKNTFGAGFTFRAGQFNSYFSNYDRPGTSAAKDYKKFQFFFFMNPVFRAVMDDATLEGGFFTHNNSPYTLTKDQITNSHMEFDYGFVIAKNLVGFSFTEKLLTEEIKSGVNQQYGTVTFFIGL